MSIVQRKGKYRLGVFEKVEIDGNTYQTQSGVGNRLTMQANGKPFYSRPAPLPRCSSAKGKDSPLAMQLQMDAQAYGAVKGKDALLSLFGDPKPMNAPVRDYAGGSLKERSQNVEIYKKPSRKK